MFHFSCTWKGQDCLDSVHETLTDMGVCYTFRHDDMFIEQSGRDQFVSKMNLMKPDMNNWSHSALSVNNHALSINR